MLSEILLAQMREINKPSWITHRILHLRLCELVGGNERLDERCRYHPTFRLTRPFRRSWPRTGNDGRFDSAFDDRRSRSRFFAAYRLQSELLYTVRIEERRSARDAVDFVRHCFFLVHRRRTGYLFTRYFVSWTLRKEVFGPDIIFRRWASMVPVPKTRTQIPQGILAWKGHRLS